MSRGPGPRSGHRSSRLASSLLCLQAQTVSKLVACCPCLVFPQTIPVWIRCRRGSGKTGVVLRLLSPENEGEASGCRLLGGSAWVSPGPIWLAPALNLVAACGRGVHGGSRSFPGQRKGTLQPQGRRWSLKGPTGLVETREVRSPVVPSSQSWVPGMPGPLGSHFLLLPGWHWQEWEHHGRGLTPGTWSP